MKNLAVRLELTWLSGRFCVAAGVLVRVERRFVAARWSRSVAAAVGLPRRDGAGFAVRLCGRTSDVVTGGIADEESWAEDMVVEARGVTQTSLGQQKNVSLLSLERLKASCSVFGIKANKKMVDNGSVKHTVFVNEVRHFDALCDSLSVSI